MGRRGANPAALFEPAGRRDAGGLTGRRHGMSSAPIAGDAPQHVPTGVAGPAPLTRGFGWLMLTALGAFLINNVLSVSFGWPGAGAALSGGGALAWVQLLLYPLALGLAALIVARSPAATLRGDARRITAFNIYLVRACFWVVFFCGIADAAIAFMRVENLLAPLFGEDLAGDLGRSQFVGTWVHAPLAALGFLVGLVTRTLGFTWLALLIVAAELLIVITRFVFSYEQALMGDLVRYWYAALFLFASAYTLLDEGHVRVDVVFAGLSPQRKGLVNAVGAVVLGMTTAWVIIWIGLGGPRSIINSSVANFEVTQAAVSGMYVKYHMAAFLAVFAITMLIQFVAYLFEGVADMRDEPGHVDHAPPTA
jgi:TRAP-type mannitol/chloroaromatic compound transport system permease small subunit